MDTLVNRIANSGLITLNLENHFPEAEFAVFDIKDYLFQGMILKEKDFRNALKEIDFSQYEDKILLIQCTADAIIPLWSYMLVSLQAEGYAKEIYIGTKEEYLVHYYNNVIKSMDVKEYEEKRVVIKGCSNKPVPAGAYAALSSALKPYAQSIMFGEPCSTVPLFKRARKLNK